MLYLSTIKAGSLCPTVGPPCSQSGQDRVLSRLRVQAIKVGVLTVRLLQQLVSNAYNLLGGRGRWRARGNHFHRVHRYRVEN